jgi:hypothetical protein
LPERSFYCIADPRYFPGAVALINSLRLTGNAERIVVLSCGLDTRQKGLLAREAEILPGPHLRSAPAAFLLRGRAPRERPAKEMILLDADLVITRSLAPLFSLAGTGQVVAFADALSDRFSERWEVELGLAPVRRQVYANAGFLALPAGSGHRLLSRLEELQTTVDESRSYWADGVPADPFFFLDQDIVNALLASEFDDDHVTVLPYRFAPHPPFECVRVDSATLRCRYPDGHEPFALHHVLSKPWLHRTAPNIYSKLLPRLLLEDDLPIRLESRELPRRLRTSIVGRAARRSSGAVAAIAAYRREVLGVFRPSRRRGVPS